MARRRLSWLRLAVIVAAGGACIFAADRYRRSRRPAPAPPDVQRHGIELVEGILAKVAGTPFGQSERGKALAGTIRRFIGRGSVIFTADIASQALYRREFLGHEALYVKALAIGGRLVQQDLELIAEGVFHEAVHALRGGGGRVSIEEECDGFAAGLAAGAAIAGHHLPEPLLIDGRPVAAFVRMAYPDSPRDPAYEPVGESRQWLARRTGLK